MLNNRVLEFRKFASNPLQVLGGMNPLAWESAVTSGDAIGKISNSGCAISGVHSLVQPDWLGNYFWRNHCIGSNLLGRRIRL